MANKTKHSCIAYHRGGVMEELIKEKWIGKGGRGAAYLLKVEMFLL